MIIYHYTDINIGSGIISPKSFGLNSYTNNDKDISAVKRSFFFTEDKAPEYRFLNSKHKYKANIKDKDIYNLTEDKQQYKKKYKSIDNILKAIKRQYKGALYNVGYNVVILFEDITAIKIRSLT